MQWKLDYNKPAECWIEALPLGNGELGAMSPGHIGNDRIDLNLDTLWSGDGRDKSDYEKLPDWNYVRKLIADGKLGAAEAYAKEHMLGDWTEGYLPAGTLILDIITGDRGSITDYNRQLSLNHALQNTRWKMDGASFNKEMFVSMADQVLAVKVSVGGIHDVEAFVTLQSPLHYETVSCTDDCELEISGRAPDYAAPNYYQCENPIRYEAGKGIRFGIALSVVLKSGSVVKQDAGIKIITHEDFYVFLTAETNFENCDNLSEKMRKTLERAKKEGYEKLKKDHLQAYHAYFDRVDLRFDEDEWGERNTLKRLQHFGKDDLDMNLMALLFHYARYLLICSSRPGTKAANLQGIWNREIRPPWSSNYTVNINTEMNYWMAESCNLSECHTPLFDLIDRTVSKGRVTAKKLYGLEGWVSHHNIDIWGHSSPVGRYGQDANPCTYSLWPMSSGWLCRHLWEHYCYTLDLDFLREKAYPVIREAVRFYLGYLTVQDEFLVTSPSTSPENVFYDKNGEPHSVTVASTMDIAILRELFENYLEICRILKVDELRQETKNAWKKLPPFKTGKHGQLQEWYEDYEETDINHRHVSHLYGLYPANLIRRDEETIRKACETALNRRGDDGTGWCIAWKASLWARLGEGERAFQLLKNQMRLTCQEQISTVGGGIYPNLFCAHPPFQIDGNFGFAAAVTEMLLQSQDNAIEFLPALPKAWKNGQVKGLKARGGFTVDFSWKDGNVCYIRVSALKEGDVMVKYGKECIRVTFQAGETKELLNKVEENIFVEG